MSIRTVNLLVGGLFLFANVSFGQQSQDGLWTATSVSESGRIRAVANAASFDEGANTTARFVPDDYRLFELDQVALTRLSGNAATERSVAENALVAEQSTISLPMPGGEFRQFQLIESPVMAPALQEKFPNIRAYRGQCLDDPLLSMRLDVAPRGDRVALRAQVHGPAGTIIVDPFGEGNQHISFVKSRNQRRGRPLHRCLQEPRAENARAAAARGRAANTRLQSGTQLRTYRIAVACTGEYAQFHGGTIASAMSAIHTTINRVNELYERDVAIRFQLVANNDLLIFIDPSSDPFNNDDAGVLISQSQAEIDSLIGDANYDIGHTFSTGAGGLAPGLVGVSGQKAKGVTGQPNPAGDPFDIDYVAHEIGHQLNADHTFNGTGCLPGARFAPTAVEPGSGSTILAYAGICNSDDLQNNSHAYFNSVSVEQIVDYSSNGTGAVGTTQSTGNNVPTVDAGGDFSIPAQTPFTLTASGNDVDNDQLFYCWEQVDRGPAARVNAPDDGNIPLFRSFPPTPDRDRVFPKWSDVLGGSPTTGEQLPSKARTMHFQVTARDNRSGGGAVGSDTSEINVVESAGPFRVTSPSSSAVSSPLVEVKWDVANTNQAPINCSHVNIRLSTDGGQTFAITLASATLNDGNELVAMPPIALNNLRVLVESVNNIFFAVNPSNFDVQSANAHVFIVRHAEKEVDGGDPALTEAGRRRARSLASLMSRLEVTHVYSTDTQRTRQTAQPTAASTGGSVETYDDISSLVIDIESLPPASRVLIVGHSNTVGPVISALGVTSAIDVGDEFDNLFAVGLSDSAPQFAKYKYQPLAISAPQRRDPDSIALRPQTTHATTTASGSDSSSSAAVRQENNRIRSRAAVRSDDSAPKQRLYRNQTKAAEMINLALESTPKLRDELNTKLYRELRTTLPKMKIGGETYYFVESDRRINEDQLLLYATELNHQYVKWRALQSQPPAVRAMIAAQQDAELVSEQEGGKIVRWKPGSTITYCILKRSFGSGQLANQRYQSVVAEFRNATQAWTSIENAVVPNFVHVNELDDSPLSGTPDGVTFAVWSIDLPRSVIASAFFPNDPQEDWAVLIDPDRYFGNDLSFDRVGVLRHELGHILGFRHEHPRSEAPLVCQTTEVFDSDVIPLGAYDPVSVMHYFCRGFDDPDQQQLNEQRRKLLLTDIDKQGVRLIYPAAGQSSGFQYLDYDPNRQSSNDLLDTRAKPMALSAPRSENTLFEDEGSGSAEGAQIELGDQPWAEPQDTVEAINNPDLYAWKLFVALNWPADKAKRQADPNRKFGDNDDTVWESWKLSSGKNDEVFLKDGADPGPWISRDAGELRDFAQPLQRRVSDLEKLPLQQMQGIEDQFHAQFDDDRSPNSLNENHLNQDAYEFIGEKELYSIEGQEKLFAEAEQRFDDARKQGRVIAPHEFKLHFPVGAKEIKAQWRQISVEDKPRYRWAEFTADDGSKLLYGLTALHITTKDIPNWFWATFEHTDNPSREGAENWQTATIDSSAGNHGYPKGLGIEGTRWENYRLRGTQVDFVDSFGNPTILANSQIESGFQHTSSCITCHARAAIGPRIADELGANRISIFKHMLPQSGGAFARIGNVGVLPEELFVQRTFSNPVTGDLQYLQLDFVWSLMRAQRKASGPGQLPDEVGFEEHIKPLFRPMDVDSMNRFFDLTNHADVSQHANAIHQRLSSGNMPCDAPWPQQRIDLFKKWIDGGKGE